MDYTTNGTPWPGGEAPLSCDQLVMGELLDARQDAADWQAECERLRRELGMRDSPIERAVREAGVEALWAECSWLPAATSAADGSGGALSFREWTRRRVRSLPDDVSMREFRDFYRERLAGEYEKARAAALAGAAGAGGAA